MRLGSDFPSTRRVAQVLLAKRPRRRVVITDAGGTPCGREGGDARSRERREESMPRRMQHAYVDGSRTARRLLEEDLLTLEELVSELDPEREDPLVSPWRRSGGSAIRRALGH